MGFWRTFGCWLAAPGVRFWAMVGAAIALTAFAGGLVWVIWHGGWPLNQAGRQLDILGKALWIMLVMILIIVVALTGQKLSAKGFNSSIDISSDGEDGHKSDQEQKP